MKLTHEEKEVIFQKIKSGEMSVNQAAQEYGVCKKTIYRVLNGNYEGRAPRPYKPRSNKVVELSKPQEELDITAYQNMTKDELIRELILAKANELRAKKGYEVKGVGANKEFIFLNKENSK